MPIPVETARTIIKKLTEEFFAEHGQEVKWGALQPFNLVLWPRPHPHFFLSVYVARLNDPNINMHELNRKLFDVDFQVEIKKKYDGMEMRKKKEAQAALQNVVEAAVPNPMPPPNA